MFFILWNWFSFYLEFLARFLLVGASLSDPNTSVTSLRLCVCMFACLLGPTTYCKSLPGSYFACFASCINSKRARGYVSVNREQSTSSMAMTTTRGLAYSVSRVMEVSAWQSVNAICFVACMTHGSCHWTVRSLLATAMEATGSTCPLISVYAISTWPAVWAGPACVHHALARPDS